MLLMYLNTLILLFIVLATLTFRTSTGPQILFRVIDIYVEFTLSMMAECGFKQMVDFPTRGDNTLDLLFTNRPSLVQSCYVTPDHDIILASIQSTIELKQL